MLQRRELELREPLEQLVAHAFLQRRGGVVTGAGAIEGLRDGAAIEREHLGGIRCVHAASVTREAAINASTWRSSCAADKVTRSRAVPAGTVGGRIAVTRKPLSSSALLIASARCASPSDHRTMAVPGRESRDTSGRARAGTARASASTFSRRHDSRWLTSSAARVAAATAGGNAVV